MRFEIMDIPALPNDSAAVGVVRIATTLTGGAWQGAGIYRSDDAGENYSRIGAADNEAIQGICIDVLPDFAGGNIFDEAATLTIILLEGELESRSELAVLNGANAALVGAEIIQFKNALLVEDNTYELSGLMRGRLGTEYAIAGHVAAERFILLDERLQKLEMANSLIGLPRKFKAAHVGELVADAAAYDFTFAANSLRPYAPVQIVGSRDGTANLSISWVRRARINADWRDGVDVPLDEASEAYEVEILDGSDVVRVISSSSPNAAYSAADQVADFGSVQTSLDIKIYQLSSSVGRGRAAVAIV
jgi:hypothetical protein